MPQYIPDPGVVGLLAPKVNVDAQIGQVVDAQNITAAFTSVGDAPSSGTVTIEYNDATGGQSGGASGLTVTIADGADSGTVTGSIALAAGGRIYRRITAESGLALNLGGYVTIDLATTADTVLATLADLKTHLGISGSADDTALTFMIQAASAYVESGANRRFLRVPYLTEIYQTGPFNAFTLREYPVDTAYSTVVKEGDTTLTAADYRIEGVDPFSPNTLVRVGDSSGLRRNWAAGDVTVSYQAGYALTPADIRNAVVELAAHRWNQRRDSTRSQLGLSSKGPTDASSESFLEQLPWVEAVIGRYSRRFT